jgi:hypothetical protein
MSIVRTLRDDALIVHPAPAPARLALGWWLGEDD